MQGFGGLEQSVSSWSDAQTCECLEHVKREKKWRHILIRVMYLQVKILRDDARVRLANQVNLTEAVRVALLTLPEKFSAEELFERIAGISYVGDFRMIVGENPNKVRNIVSAQKNHFHRLYFGLLDDLPNVAILNNDQYQVSLLQLI